MITLNNWYSRALAKLDSEKKAVAGQKEKVMASPVLTVIKDFCRQEEEFAQAVVQGGTFADCMKAVANGVGNAISDNDAFTKAVRFYFPGAAVQIQMTIDIGKQKDRPAADPAEVLSEPKKESSKVIRLNLEDFL